MTSDIIGALICFCIGAVVALINYLLSKHILLKSPKNYASTTVVRQILQVLFLVLVYIVGKKISLDVIYLLIGAALGMTIPLFYFTKKLLKLNSANNKEKEA